MTRHPWYAAALSISFLGFGCGRERPAESPRPPPPIFAPPPQPAPAPAAAPPGGVFGGGLFVLVQPPPLADLLGPFLRAGSVTPSAGASCGSDACRDQELVRLSRPRIVSLGPVWRAGEQAQLEVLLTSPITNANYTGFRASHDTPGITPRVGQVHPSQGLLAGRPTPIRDLFRADPSVPPGTRVRFHIVVSPGEDCPAAQAIEFEAMVH